MSKAWMIVPVFPILALIVVGFYVVDILASIVSKGEISDASTIAQRALTQLIVVYGAVVVLGFLSVFLGAVALYFMIDRRNNHFKRQQRLFTSISSYVETKFKERELASTVPSALLSIAEDERYEETEKPAAVWAVLYLFVTPIVGLLIGHFLTRDIGRHHEREVEFVRNLETGLRQLGVPFTSASPYEVKKRDTMFYVILTLVTGGLFWIYWFYTLLKDYNEHFRSQWAFEDQFASAVRSRLEPSIAPPTAAPPTAGMACKQCGATIPSDAKFCPMCGARQM